MTSRARRPLFALLTAALATLAAAGCAQPHTAVGEKPSPAKPRPAASPESRPSAATAPARQPANILSYERADWLERPGREELEKPDLVLAALDLAPGLVVAEVGTGTGFFARRIAPRVLPGGKVLAEDVQPEMLTLLRRYAGRDGVTAGIVPVLGTETDPKLPQGGVDRVLLVDVYHEFQQPAPMLAKIRASLKPGGKVVLVEYREEDESASHINKDHRMSVEQVLAEWQPAGFELVERREELPSQHLFIFRVRNRARSG